MKSKVKIYLAIEFIVFLVLAILLYKYEFVKINYYNLLYFLIVTIVTNNISMFFNSKSEIITTILLPVLFPAMVLFGPFWTAVIAGIGSTELKFRDNFIWYKFLFNRSMFFLAGGGAALVYQLTNNFFDSTYLIFPFFLASITYFLINNGLLFIIINLTAKGEGKSPSMYFIELPKNLISSYFLGLFLHLSYINFGKIFFILMIVLIYVLKDFLYSRLQQLNSYTQIVESFLKVIDSKDHYTEGHCERVAQYTCILCKELNLPRSEINRIVNIAKIHDIGKINVEDRILKSNKRLSIEDYEKMKKHSYYGYKLLKDIDLLRQDSNIILHHHEWYNGQGYPDKLKGKDIPRGARILSICDAFDVMTTGRSYKESMTKGEIIDELIDYRGKQFDPEYTDTMISLIKNNKFNNVLLKEKKINESELSLNC